MKKVFFIVSILFFCFISLNYCYSQQFPQDTVITIIMDNWQEFKGKVIKQDESVLLLESTNGERYTIVKNDIKGVVQNEKLSKEIQEKKVNSEKKQEDVKPIFTDEASKDNEGMPSSNFKTLRPYSQKNKISLTYYHYFFERSSDVTTLSGIYEVNGNFSIGKTTRLIVGLPFSTFSITNNYSFESSSESYSTIGNIYFGIESLFGKDLNSTLSFGIYLPTINDRKAMYETIIADYPNMGKFIPNSFSPYINFNYKSNIHPNLYYGIVFGINGFIPTKDHYDTEACLNYRLLGGFENPDFGFSLGFPGIMIITEDYEDFTDRIFNYLAFEFHYNGKGWQPQIIFQKPLRNEVSKIIDGFLGFRVNFFF